ncbi:MAG: enoyl-CoA hydratase/isomerase family protein [Burkholderiales bacterium]|nr:enoyl-CoA hydratase/isomerase family protein [Burkholderiales bacterium]
MAAEGAGTPATTLEFGAGIARCRLECHGRGNALSVELVRGVADALAQACARTDVHTLLLHGAGRHFCTGFDLASLPQETDASLLARFVEIELLLDALWRAPVRTVAVGHGAIVGAGADLFAACDVRMLASSASLRFPGAGFGIVLGTRRLACRVGPFRALRWVSEGTQVPAAEALATGLATAITEMGPENDAHVDAALALLGDLGVARETFSALRATTDDGAADADLAALVRSATRPGLKARIEAYATRTAARRGAK